MTSKINSQLLMKEKVIESYSMNCSVLKNNTKYSIKGKTRLGLQISAEVDTVSGRATIQGEKLSLKCN